MSETVVESATAGEGLQAPLPPALLPPAVRALLAGPRASKVLAASGAAVLRPGELLIALYQLTFDAEAAVSEAAAAAPASLPDQVLVAPLGDPLPAPVLNFVASRIAVTRTAAFERIILNRGTADETFVAMAGRLPDRQLEMMFQNEERLLRCPAILSALYLNKQARMSSLNRAIELCARNGVQVEAIPGFDEIVRSIRADPAASDPRVADQAFGSLLGAAEAAGDEPADEEDSAKKSSPIIDFTKLKLHEKIRLATLGNAYCRTNLIRDPNKVVAMAAVRSPLIQETEIVRAAANRNVAEDVIRYIANQRELVKMYAVRLNLVQNPKCPVAFSVRFLPLLHNDDIRKLARSKNIPSALSVAARKLVQNRGLGG